MPASDVYMLSDVVFLKCAVFCEKGINWYKIKIQSQHCLIIPSNAFID